MITVFYCCQISYLLSNQDFIHLITPVIDFLVVSVVAISIVQAIAPLMKVMIRNLASITNSFHHEPGFQEQDYLFKHNYCIAKKNLVRGLLFALELESANAILKMGIFTSFFVDTSSLTGTSSGNIVSNFVFFLAVLSVRIGINQGLRRFDV